MIVESGCTSSSKRLIPSRRLTIIITSSFIPGRSFSFRRRKISASPRCTGWFTSLAGFFCSIWFFARFAAFFVLSHWTGWQYRFSWLVAGKLALIVGFMGMLVPNNLWIVLVMQVVFGLGVGMLYYSSLFYAMDLGETKSEHGGLHESALGVGIFVGSAIGALSEQYHPESRAGSTLAVSCFLALGFVAMLALRARGNRPKS